jgi:hypothetical protein
MHYYNQDRVHQSLDGDAPDEVSGVHQPLQAKFGNYSWISHCNGLFQTPIAACIGIRHTQAVYARDPFGNMIELCQIPTPEESPVNLAGVAELGNFEG